jgi:hypothetical protein
MEELNVPAAITSQFGAALEMLEKAVEACPEPLWLAVDCPNRFWHVAYHALFFTHLYLEAGEKAFQPWTKHRPNYQILGATPWPPHERPTIGEPFSRQDVLEYLAFCREEVNARVGAIDIAAPSGFHWLPFNRLETHLYNLRHLQHHTGQLLDRLRTVAGTGVAWVRSA